MKAEENNLEWYVRNSNETLMAGARKIKILDSEAALNLKGTGRMPAYIDKKQKKNVWSIPAGNARDS